MSTHGMWNWMGLSSSTLPMSQKLVVLSSSESVGVFPPGGIFHWFIDCSDSWFLPMKEWDFTANVCGTRIHYQLNETQLSACAAMKVTDFVYLAMCKFGSANCINSENEILSAKFYWLRNRATGYKYCISIRIHTDCTLESMRIFSMRITFHILIIDTCNYDQLKLSLFDLSAKVRQLIGRLKAKETGARCYIFFRFLQLRQLIVIMQIW